MGVHFTDNRVKIKDLINTKGLAWLEEACAEIESQAIRNTRVDTGQTKKAWNHKVNQAEGEAQVGNTLENAIWEELGTGEFAINGDGRKGGWIYKDPKTGKYICTNGKKPSRAFKKAYETSKNKITESAKGIFGGIGK